LEPAATNLAITVSGTPTAFSHLLLKAGVAPSDTSYDFIALADVRPTQSILEAPEFLMTNYVASVRTPTGFAEHSFTVNCTERM